MSTRNSKRENLLRFLFKPHLKTPPTILTLTDFLTSWEFFNLINNYTCLWCLLLCNSLIWLLNLFLFDLCNICKCLQKEIMNVFMIFDLADFFFETISIFIEVLLLAALISLMYIVLLDNFIDLLMFYYMHCSHFVVFW